MNNRYYLSDPILLTNWANGVVNYLVIEIDSIITFHFFDGIPKFPDNATNYCSNFICCKTVNPNIKEFTQKSFNDLYFRILSNTTLKLVNKTLKESLIKYELMQ